MDLISHFAMPSREQGIQDALMVETFCSAWGFTLIATYAMALGPVLAFPRTAKVSIVAIFVGLYFGYIEFKNPLGISIESVGLILTLATSRIPFEYKVVRFP